MKLKRIIQIFLAAIVAAVIVLGLLSNFITDFWWFKDLGFTGVFWTQYETQYTLWFVGFIVFLLLMNLNLSIAMRGQGTEVVDSRLENFIQVFGKYIKYVVYLIALVLAFIMAGTLSGSWMELLRYSHAQGFGVDDPVFGHDIGFYLFTLPFLQSVRTWLIAAVILIIIATVVVYVVRQGVSFALGKMSMSAKARRHVAILLGAFFIITAWSYYLDRYGILNSSRSGSFYGAGYADIYAQLPASWIMVFVALIFGLLIAYSLFANKLKRLFKLLISGLVITVLVTMIYPSLLQKFIVAPTEISKELPYIKNNIRFTRLAYDLASIQEKTISPKFDLTSGDLRADTGTIRNIMLWDYRPLASTFDQLQVIRLYYHFPDVDIDRYHMPDGRYRQVMLSARELDQQKLPANARTWVNLNLVYTHGYGLGMSPVNVVTEEGLPEFFVKDIPPESSVGLKIDRPEIYFGEETKTPVIIKGNIEEFDYPLGDANKMTKYQEDAGVSIGSLLRRLIFAIHFGDMNMLISGYLMPESRILYNRTIQERVKKIAPFLTFDKDPYLVIAGGRLCWIYDAYTTTSDFPYSKPMEDFNYIRNSVKVVIDAYNGKTTFYTFGEKSDPLIRVYRGIFPGLFRDESEMPQTLREHVRYPQDLFDAQADIFETYHMEDPKVFYNKEDLWNVANEKAEEKVSKMESYYVVMRLPGEQKEEFIQMIPYTPNKRDNMIAWLCARSDGDKYGHLLVYKFPKQDLTYGPMQVAARIDQDPLISQQLTLWNQQGSSVTRGNLLVIPIKEEVMYIQPVYLQATTGKLPELKRVIVSYGNRISMQPTLDQALEDVFKGSMTSPPAGSTPAEIQASEKIGTFDTKQLSKSALDKYTQAMKYLKDGNWAKYGEQLELLKKDLEQMVKLNK